MKQKLWHFKHTSRFRLKGKEKREKNLYFYCISYCILCHYSLIYVWYKYYLYYPPVTKVKYIVQLVRFHTKVYTWVWVVFMICPGEGREPGRWSNFIQFETEVEA